MTAAADRGVAEICRTRPRRATKYTRQGWKHQVAKALLSRETRIKVWQKSAFHYRNEFSARLIAIEFQTARIQRKAGRPGHLGAHTVEGCSYAETIFRGG